MRAAGQASPGVVSAAAGVDDAEPVAVGVGEHDEVRVLRVQVPLHPLSTQGHQPIHLGGLLGGVVRVQVQVDPRMLLDRCLTQPERQLDPGPAAGINTTQSPSISLRGR